MARYRRNRPIRPSCSSSPYACRQYTCRLGWRISLDSHVSISQPDFHLSGFRIEHDEAQRHRDHGSNPLGHIGHRDNRQRWTQLDPPNGGMTGGNGWCFPSCTSFEMNAEYYAIAPTVLSNDNTTVEIRSYQGAPALLDGFEFALTGVDANSPFDPSPGLPAIGQCPNYPNDNQSCSVNIQTSQGNDFVFVIVSLGNWTCTTNGFTNILAHSHLEVDYLDPAGPGSATFTCLDGSYSQPAVIIGDAVADPPSTTSSTGTVTSGGGGRGPLRI